MSAEKTFKQFYIPLVTTLPMDDVIFVATLYSSGVLPGKLKSLLWSEPTAPAKASLFLDKVIGPSVSIGDSERLYMLLDCMEEHESKEVQDLAKKIKSQFRSG